MIPMVNTAQLTRIALVVMLVMGCFFVLLSFMAAILFAAIICIFTWPLYFFLLRRLGHRDTLAAITMTLLLLVSLILPMTFLAANFADFTATLVHQLQPLLQNMEPKAPDWMRSLPIIGTQVSDSWDRVAVSHEELIKMISQYYEPMRRFSLQAVQIVLEGLLQLVLVVFIAFFFYRDGSRLAKGLMGMARKIGGELGVEILNMSRDTVQGVMLGIFGTALAQGLVAFIGFEIAGVPMPLLLAAMTFCLSVIPVGPPLVWGGASLWLYSQGEHGLTLFLVLYGFLVISSVDNVLKPLLISRSSNLPILLAVLGVLGGIVAFGFIGIFLGPTLLAIALTLLKHWFALHNQKAH